MFSHAGNLNLESTYLEMKKNNQVVFADNQPNFKGYFVPVSDTQGKFLFPDIRGWIHACKETKVGMADHWLKVSVGRITRL